jgi:hypothetical protein
MKIQVENDKTLPTLTQIALAGAGSGIVSSFVITVIHISDPND